MVGTFSCAFFGCLLVGSFGSFIVVPCALSVVRLSLFIVPCSLVTVRDLSFDVAALNCLVA